MGLKQDTKGGVNLSVDRRRLKERLKWAVEKGKVKDATFDREVETCCERHSL